MIPGIGGPLTNSGSMPITGGAANSGSGDTMFRNQSKFGGLNFNPGTPPWIYAAGIGVVALFVALKYA